jgi:hypothetical protein
MRCIGWVVACGVLAGFGRLGAGPIISPDEVEARAVLAKYASEFGSFTDEQSKQLEAANMKALKSVSIETVRTFLAKEVTLADVLKTFGRPFHVSMQEYEGVLWYRLPDRRDLIFWVKGNGITEASYGSEYIKGLARVNQMRIAMKPTGTIPGTGKSRMEIGTEGSVSIIPSPDTATYSARFCLNEESFDSMDAFQKRLRKLPSGSVVVWQVSCLVLGGDEPLRTEEQLNVFKEFCREAGLRLIVNPAG